MGKRQGSKQHLRIPQEYCGRPRPTTTSKMADGPDMEQRDINLLNSHVKVVFEEVLGEPEGVRSIDCVWRNSYACFNGTLNICYKILTVLCGIPLAFCWGCEFACTACYHIWYMTPLIRDFRIHCMAFEKMLRICTESCLSPCMESCGACLSQMNKDGAAPKATPSESVTVKSVVQTTVVVEETTSHSPKPATPHPSVHSAQEDKQEETEA